MKDINRVIADKKYDVLLKLVMMLHREHLEIIRIMLMLNMKPDQYKETFSKIESDWEGIQREIIGAGFKVTEEDLND